MSFKVGDLIVHKEYMDWDCGEPGIDLPVHGTVYKVKSLNKGVNGEPAVTLFDVCVHNGHLEGWIFNEKRFVYACSVLKAMYGVSLESCENKARS